MTETPKYIMTSVADHRIDDTTLYRIVALRDFGNVKKGDMGGIIEAAHNLSQEGNCWVSDNAVVMGFAQVSEDAIVADRACVHEEARIGGSARILGNARVGGIARVSGHARIGGDTDICGSPELGGNTRIDGLKPGSHGK